MVFKSIVCQGYKMAQFQIVWALKLLAIKHKTVTLSDLVFFKILNQQFREPGGGGAGVS